MNTQTTQTKNNILTRQKVFHLRSEGAQEIISHKPGFLEKWALLLFLAVMALLTLGTWFIRYPDMVQAKGRLMAGNAPKEIIPMQSGRLVQLLVHDGDMVRKGETLGWIESAADAREAIALSLQLDGAARFMVNNNRELPDSFFKIQLQNLGSLQASYQVFMAAMQEYKDYVVNGFYERKKGMLLNDIAALQKMNRSTQMQKQLTQEDEDSAMRTLKMNKILLDEKVISAEEFRVAKSKYLNKKMAIPQLNASLTGNQTEQRNKLKEIQQLDHDIARQSILFEQAILTLKSEVDHWMQQYVLTAPVSGTIVFALPLEANRFIEQGRLLAYINPPDSKYYVEVNLPQNNLGKVDTGMKVQLRFDAYPYQEAGFVKGRLAYISPIASDSGFLAIVRLPFGLRSSLQKPFQYKNGLSVQALVITKDMRLLQRIWYSIIKSISPGK